MTTKYRISFESFYGDFDVVARCYLIDPSGQIILPPGTLFSWSPNHYSDSINFESGYRGTQQWHSARGPLVAPLWGVVEFPAPQKVAGIYWRATGAEVAKRSPKNWRVEAWDSDSGQWVVVRENRNEPTWSAGEIRVYSLILVSGRVMDLVNNSSPRVALFDWDFPARHNTATPQSNGHWDACLPSLSGQRYGIYYLSRDNRCPPIIHGPYTAE